MEVSVDHAPTLLQNILRYLVLCVPLCFFLPVAAIEVMMAIAILFFIASWLQTPRYDNDIFYLILTCLGFWLYGIIHSLWIMPVDHSLMTTLPWIRYPLFMLACQYTLEKHPGLDRQLIHIMVFTACIISIDTLIQYFHGTDLLGQSAPNLFHRLSGPLTKPRIGTLLAFLFVPITLALMHMKTDKIWHCLYHIITLMLTISAILLSGERFAVLIAAGGCFLGLIMLPAVRRYLWMLIGLTLALVITWSAIDSDFVERDLRHTKEQISHFAHCDYGLVWAAGRAMIWHYPWTGIGVKQYPNACKKLALSPTPYHLEITEMCQTINTLHAHNIYLQIMGELGVFGLIFWLAILVSLAQLTRQQPHPIAQAFWVIAWTRLLPLLPASSFYAVWFMMPFWFSCGIALARRKT